MHIPKPLKKLIARWMVVLSLLTSDALANTLEKNTITTGQSWIESTVDIDKQIEDYYKELITIQNYEYTELFKKLRKEKKEGWLRNEVYKDCVTPMILGDFWVKKEAMDVLILGFWAGTINRDIESVIIKRLSEKKAHIYCVGQIHRIIKLSIELEKEKAELEKEKAELEKEKAELAELDKTNKHLESVLNSLKAMNKLFQENKQK